MAFKPFPMSWQQGDLSCYDTELRPPHPRWIRRGTGIRLLWQPFQHRFLRSPKINFYRLTRRVIEYEYWREMGMIEGIFHRRNNVH